LSVKTLGIVGGLGPESTIEYYRSIIQLYRDGSYPGFILNNVDLKKGLDFMAANDLAGMTDYLVEEIGKLARAGASFGLIAANTPHIVFDDVAPRSPIPLISIVEATCAVAKARKMRRIALFGTRYTMQGPFYPKVFSRDGIELVAPDSEDQNYVHDKYMTELVNGVFLPETRTGLLEIADRLRQEQQIDGLVLAGTELPLLLNDESHNGLPILNTTKIHVEAAVNEMMS
jgi:aspartate racemase